VPRVARTAAISGADVVKRQREERPSDLRHAELWGVVRGDVTTDFGQHDGAADRGSAVVEFALVLPLLLLVVLAVVQVGLLGRDQLLVTQSSRVGARGR